MQETALITGGAGFIGLHLARYLAARQHVTIADNFGRGKQDGEFRRVLEHPNVSFIPLDITDQNAFSRLDRYDSVYHLAAINGTENFYKIPDQVFKVGAVGTVNMLEWFVEKKKGKFLLSSSSEAYAGSLKLLGDRFPIPTPEEVPLTVEDPSNVRWSYGAGKIASEVAVHAYHHVHRFPFSIIRYHNIYGPRMGTEHVIPQFAERIVKKENPFRIFGGTETRTFCYVDDALKATSMVMNSPATDGKTIHIGRSDGEIRILDLAEMLFEIAEFHPKIEILPAPAGSVQRRCPDVSRLQALGYHPQTGLQEGLRETFRWYERFWEANA